MDEPLHIRMDLSRPALERLIGGDTEIEAKLREQVVNEFCKRHLKELLNNEVIQRADAAWRTTIATEAAKAVMAWAEGNATPGAARSSLKHAVQRDLAQAKEALLVELRQRMREEAELFCTEYRVRTQEMIKREVARAVADCIPAEVAAQVREGIKARLAAIEVAAKGES